jgi:protein-S-isoprenylcysteine O-methyltransferase Ste14
MRSVLNGVAWLVCVVYSTIPSFWFMVHPFAEKWRARQRSPYRILLPAWMGMWVVAASITWRWRRVVFYESGWLWIPAACLFACGIYLYSQAGRNFSAKHLGGIPEVHGRSSEQRLVTDGIRSRVRHPVYLAHLCEMLAWSLGTGLAVCWGLTACAVATGAVMVHLEDAELEKRFGDRYRDYKRAVPAVFPRI